MLQKILLFLTTSFLCSIGAVAQDVQVDVQNLLYDQNGNIVEFGQIQLTFNPDILPVDIIIEPTSCTGPNGGEGDVDEIVWTFNPGTGVCFGEDATQYCFRVVTNVGTPEECSIDFCVTILLCRLKEWKEGQYIRTCLHNPSPNDEHPTFSKTNPNNQNQEQITAKAKEKNNGITETTIEEIEWSDESSVWETFTLHKAYPNPFNNQVNIELESAQTEKATVRLLDLMGKDVHHEVIELQQGDNKWTLTPQQNLPSGTYLLHIYRHDGQLITAKLIKVE